MTAKEIEYKIKNGSFNWQEYSYMVAVVADQCPEMFDPDQYNWDKHSWYVARYCPQHFDPELYNWEKDSWAIAKYCSYRFVPELYNWKLDSGRVVKYCPEHFDASRYNWQDEFAINVIREYAPHLLLKKLSMH